MSKLLLLLSFLYHFSSNHAQNGALVTVTTPRGSITGFRIDQGNDTTKDMYGQADVFLGIPYATPPVGDLRYKTARPLTRYPGNGPYNATYYRKGCVSVYTNISTMSEDCLFASSTTKYPVMVWIHGGGFVFGDSHLWNPGAVRNFAYRGVILVSIDYRMGWLGSFTTRTEEFPANLGLIDQVVALRFIKEEIPYFGGDPNKITIFGESAGGVSVSLLTYSPLTRGLFQQAITESGNMITCLNGTLGPTDYSFQMANRACNYTQEMWDSGNFTMLKECLMSISVEDGTRIADPIGDRNSLCWTTVQDNFFFPDTPINLYKNRPNIPIIIGMCKDEYGLWEVGNANRNLSQYTKSLTESKISEQFSEWFGNNSAEVMQIFEQNYIKSGTADDDHLAWLQFIDDVDTAAFFGMAATRDVSYYIQNNNPNVYAYEFDWSSSLNDQGNKLTNWTTVPHTCELQYVFGWSGGWEDADKSLGMLVEELWTNFAKYGKPTLDNSWKPVTSTDPNVMEYFQINAAQNSSTKNGFRKVDNVVFNQLLPPILGPTPPNNPDNTPVCPRGYQSKVKSTTCYEAFNMPGFDGWDVAETACVHQSYGNLVSIGSAFENSDLLAYVKAVHPSCASFYIGLFRSGTVSNETWVWTNYDTSAYRNWKSDYPSKDPNESCVVLSAADGTWVNQACNIPTCYICSYF